MHQEGTVRVDRIGVLVIDGHLFHREVTVRALMEEDTIEVLGEASEGDEALYQVTTLNPDVLVVDPDLEAVNGFDLTRQTRRYNPTISVVIFTSHDDDDSFFLAICAGAAGFLCKSSSYAALASEITRASRGEYPINEGLLERSGVALRVLQRFQDMLLLEREVEPLISPLSRREKEILEHIARGNANKEIATALGIRNQTVKNHVNSIMRKLAANDRTHAVVLALRHGLITLP